MRVLKVLKKLDSSIKVHTDRLILKVSELGNKIELEDDFLEGMVLEFKNRYSENRKVVRPNTDFMTPCDGNRYDIIGVLGIFLLRKAEFRSRTDDYVFTYSIFFEEIQEPVLV